MLPIIGISIAIGFLLETISWFVRIRRAAAWVDRERRRPINASCSRGRRLFILIPVLHEADILEETVQYFDEIALKGDPDAWLVVVTTEREYESVVTRGESDTVAIARTIASNDPRIIHIHFPEISGKMAHQLNYAVKELRRRFDGLHSDDVLSVYNADSRPERSTFPWVRSRYCFGGVGLVFQQYGCYTGNLKSLQRASHASVLISAALWQTRWALGFEIDRSLRQFPYQGHLNHMWYPFNYCIGHGLFLTVAIYERVHGFSEDTHNEDAILGLQLSEAQELIAPVPYFDVSESPDSLRSLYRQKANWYFGPLQAYAYARLLLHNHKRTAREKVRLFFLATQLFSHALFWICGPTMITAAVFFGIVSKNAYTIGAAICALCLFGLASIFSYRHFVMWGVVQDTWQLFVRTTLKNILGFPVMYVLHGASAYRGLVLYLLKIITGRSVTKEKTITRRAAPFR